MGGLEGAWVSLCGGLEENIVWDGAGGGFSVGMCRVWGCISCRVEK